MNFYANIFIRITYFLNINVSIQRIYTGWISRAYIKIRSLVINNFFGKGKEQIVY